MCHQRLNYPSDSFTDYYQMKSLNVATETKVSVLKSNINLKCPEWKVDMKSEVFLMYLL